MRLNRGSVSGTGGDAGPGLVGVFESGFDLACARWLFLRRRRRFEERHPRAQLRAHLLDLVVALPLTLRLEPPALRFARQLLRVRA